MSPVFEFKAKKLTGEEIKGVREAANRFGLASQLRGEGFILVQSKEKKEHPGSYNIAALFGGVPLVEKMLFARNLSVMVGAGVSLTKALEVLKKQTNNKNFKAVLDSLAESIKAGESLYEAMEKHKRVFSGLFRAMVKAGEKSGQLDNSLKLVARQLERQHDLRKKIRGAFMYPIIIVIAIIAIAILMLIYVVPTLIDVFADLGAALPLTTRIIIAMSTFLVENTLVFFFALFLALFLFAVWVRTAEGRKLISTIFLRTPLISGLVKKINAARTARTLSSLVVSGVKVLEALEVTEDVVQNHHFKMVIRQAREEIQRGNPVSAAFIKNADIYPVLVGEMMQVGEETGKLGEMLMRLAVFYEEEVAAQTKDLSTIIEPVLMILVGIAAGIFALSIIQPLYSVVGAI